MIFGECFWWVQEDMRATTQASMTKPSRAFLFVTPPVRTQLMSYIICFL